MKYIQKTFINSHQTDKLDELSAWYVKHKVRRFLSSKTNVPLWVYRKINFISTFQDFYHLNDFKNEPGCILEWNKKDDYISINLPHRQEELIYLSGRLEHYIRGKLVNTYDRQIPDYINKDFKNYYIPTNKDIDNFMKKREEQRELRKLNYKKPLSKMKDYELYSYYRDLDKESANISHLAYLENLMLERNLGSLIRLDRKHDLNNPDYINFYDREVLYCPF